MPRATHEHAYTSLADFRSAQPKTYKRFRELRAKAGDDPKDRSIRPQAYSWKAAKRASGEGSEDDSNHDKDYVPGQTSGSQSQHASKAGNDNADDGDSILSDSESEQDDKDKPEEEDEDKDAEGEDEDKDEDKDKDERPGEEDEATKDDEHTGNDGEAAKETRNDDDEEHAKEREKDKAGEGGGDKTVDQDQDKDSAANVDGGTGKPVDQTRAKQGRLRPRPAVRLGAKKAGTSAGDARDDATGRGHGHGEPMDVDPPGSQNASLTQESTPAQSQNIDLAKRVEALAEVAQRVSEKITMSDVRENVSSTGDQPLHLGERASPSMQCHLPVSEKPYPDGQPESIQVVAEAGGTTREARGLPEEAAPQSSAAQSSIETSADVEMRGTEANDSIIFVPSTSQMTVPNTPAPSVPVAGSPLSELSRVSTPPPEMEAELMSTEAGDAVGEGEATGGRGRGRGRGQGRGGSTRGAGRGGASTGGAGKDTMKDKAKAGSKQYRVSCAKIPF